MNQPDFLKRILRNDPGFEDQDAKQMVVGVLSATLVVDILLIIANISAWVMAIFGVLLLITLLLALRGRLTPGRLLMPFAGLVMFGFLMFRNYGLRDTAILGLPMILLSASLMVGRWGAMFYGALSLAMIVVLGWAEANGYVRTALSASLTWSDYVAVGTSIVLTTIMQWLIIGRLNENIAKARRNEEAQKIANAALRASEARHRALLDAIPELVFRFSRDGVFMDYHAPHDNHLLASPDFFMGKSVRCVMPPDVVSKTTQAIHQVLQTGQAAQFEYSLAVEGQVQHFDARMVASGPGEVLTTVRDITDRRQVEEALRKSETQLRLLWESSSDGMRLTDAQGKIVMVNEAFCRIVGKPKQALEGQSLEVIYMTHVHEQTLRDYREMFAARTIRSYFEGPLNLWNGQRPWYGVATSFFEVEGQAPLLLCLFRNMSERKQAEQQLQQRLNELAVVNAISQASATQLELNALLELVAQELLQVFDIQGIFIALYDSKTYLLHFPYWHSQGQLLEVVPQRAGLAAKIVQLRQPLLINEDYERRFVELGGTRVISSDLDATQVISSSHRFPKAWLGVPMFARNEIIGVIAMQNFEHENAFTEADVRLLTTIAMNVGIAVQNAQLYTAAQQELTERKRIQLEREKLITELEAKNAELERFTYTVSHDLKSPLITIRGFLGFVEKDALAGNLERLRVDMDRITDATDKMQRLLRELLELSRIGRMMNPPEVVPFDAIVREAVELVRGRIEARGVQVEIASNLPTVYGDRARLVEVVQNLVDNAAKFLGDQPSPRIEIDQRGIDTDGKPIFFVRDNGIGIEAQYHDKIFGLFNKLDAETEGTGVGLALVKRIIEVHGGRIWIESEAGRGATFCFTITMPETTRERPKNDT